MRAGVRKAIRALPRSWTDRLFAAMLTAEGRVVWQTIAEIVLEALPEDMLVVWETFDTTAFRRARDGSIASTRGSDIHALRAPAIYNGLNLGFTDAVRLFDDTMIEAAGIARAPLLSHLRPLGSATVDFLHEKEIHATLACYGPAAAAGGRRQILETLRPVVAACVAALFERRRAEAAGAGLAGFLREVPVGLILVDWFGTVLTVNDEGCRQAVIWNEAPHRASMKRARERFAVPIDLTAGWSRLKGEWIDWLRGDGPQPQPLLVRHGTDPKLEVMIQLVHDQDAPNSAAPCFMARFAGVHSRGERGTLIPTPAQVAILSQLSPAERAVALRVQAGLSNREIADELGRQVGTVKDHLTSIYSKLGIARRAQLVAALH